MFVLRQDASIFYKIKWYVNNVTLVKTVTVSEADIDQATLSSKDLAPVNHTAGLQVQKRARKTYFLTLSVLKLTKKQHTYENTFQCN